MQQKTIVYISRGCSRCRALKRWLRRNKISFKEKDLTSTNVMTELVMRNLAVLSAPILEAKNRFFLPHQIFDADNQLTHELKQFLKLTKKEREK